MRLLFDIRNLEFYGTFAQKLEYWKHNWIQNRNLKTKKEKNINIIKKNIDK
jgi:hypothetical protein